ncbi:aldo/keto reductase [Bifidobacterium psychraerophilum]|uniref:aldo/keto reductase n=1 Tax=Bifidobacterium psychraerophilum TaxID=218140 RepID=UPI00333F8509
MNEGFEIEAIESGIEGSLGRLNTGCRDLYILHRFGYGTTIEETVQALDALVKPAKSVLLVPARCMDTSIYNLQENFRGDGRTALSGSRRLCNLL